MNRFKAPATVPYGSIVAQMIAVNARNIEKFARLFDAGYSLSDTPESRARSAGGGGSVAQGHDSDAPVKVLHPDNANCGLRGEQQEQEQTTLLDKFIGRGLFSVHPKRVPASVDGELSLPLLDESPSPLAETKQRRFFPEETQRIREEVENLLNRGIIRLSKSLGVARVLRIRKKNGTVRGGLDW